MKFTVGGSYGEMKEDFKLLIKKNRDLLSLNGIDLNKIRFVFVPSFQYDIDADIIDPNYIVMIPTNKNGLFNKKSSIIEINKPKNVVTVQVQTHKKNNNYIFLKELVKKTKRGIVIYIIEHQDAVDSKGNLFDYEFDVDHEYLRLRDLDDVIPELVEETKQIL